MPWMTILRCAGDTSYAGSITDLARRVRDHNDGTRAQYTVRRRPVELVHVAEFSGIGQAYAAEKQVQGWSRAKRVALIGGEFEVLPGLAKMACEKYRRGKRKASSV